MASSEPVSPLKAPATAAPKAAARLGWLDALRGVGALVVAFHHSSYAFMSVTHYRIGAWADLGWYGVLVFFLVSGYIIPASLERRGSVRGFWISRFFRMYPLWAAACAAVLLLAAAGGTRIRPDLVRLDALPSAVAHLTMLQDLLYTPNMINVLWTLSYEMVFYLMVVGLFVVGLHRRSTPMALGLALVAVVAGGTLPRIWFVAHWGTDTAVWITFALMATAIGLAVWRPGPIRVAGGVIGLLLGLTLLCFDSRIWDFQGILIIAVMFTGTAVYRAEHRQIPRWSAALAVLGVLAIGIRIGYEYNSGAIRQFNIPLVAAFATFGLGWLLRGRRIPRWLTTLGLISYSVYLLHPVLIMLTDHYLGRYHQDRPLVELAFLAALAGLSLLTYRYVEKPAQGLGRRIAGQLEPRPADPAPAPAPGVRPTAEPAASRPGR